MEQPQPIPFIGRPMDPQRKELLDTLLLEELLDIYEVLTGNGFPSRVARGKSQEIFHARITGLINVARERFAHQQEELHGQ